MWPPDGWRNGKTADALPAAGKARRFLGCVLTGGHKCDGQSDDTTRAAQPSRRRGSLAALSAATRTRAPKRATGTFFSLRSCPVRASARVIPKETPSFRMVFLFGAGDEARTRYLDLGKVALYQMSYARKRKIDCSTRIGVCQSRIFSFSSKSL